MRPCIGLDIGGANIKASDGESRSLSRPFPMWREPDRLAGALREIVAEFPSPVLLAVTMTGELADCFATKADGVRHILDAVESVAGQTPTTVWTTSGELVAPRDARELVPLVAAANWHALATWAARTHPHGTALLIDMGSTTTDVIPLCDGIPVPQGRTDLERLCSSELVYSGVKRTPVCAVAREVPLCGGTCPLAAEHFATMLDVHLLLGNVAENESDTNTANGRPATRAEARFRLTRMLCSDVTDVDAGELSKIARFLAQTQAAQLQNAIARVLKGIPNSCESLIISGEGEPILRQITATLAALRGVPVLSITRTLGLRHSEAACAYALARLSLERATAGL